MVGFFHCFSASTALDLDTTTDESSENIVSPSEITIGESFTVTCDATRAGVPENVTTVYKLAIAWRNVRAQPVTYARYRTFFPPYSLQVRKLKFNTL